MIDLNIRVVYNGEKMELSNVKGSDIVALERRFAVALPSLRGFTFEQAAFLCWRIMRREHGVTVDFDDVFLDGIEDLEQIEAPFVPPAEEASPD
jgi:hypothetical protein